MDGVRRRCQRDLGREGGRRQGEREDYEDGDNEALVLGEMAQCPVLTESSLLRAMDGISNTAAAARLIWSTYLVYLRAQLESPLLLSLNQTFILKFRICFSPFLKLGHSQGWRKVCGIDPLGI